MGAGDYILVPKDIALASKWFGWRGVIGLICGITTAISSSLIISTEAAMFAGLFVLWIIAGYSSKIFLGAAGLVLIGILGLGVYDPNYKVGETVIVEWLARWIIYVLSAGIILLAHERFTANSHTNLIKKPNRIDRSPNQTKSMHVQMQREKQKPLTQTPMLTLKTPAKKSVTIHTRPVHPAYTPTKKRIKPRPKGPIQI